MEPDFSSLFHQSSKDRAKGHPPIPLNDSDWPASWKTIEYKVYPRLPKILLPTGDLKADLAETLKNRRSSRDFSGKPLALHELGTLLKYACGEKGGERRTHPSGGARFPIEIYPIVLNGSGELKEGAYHYHIPNHALEVLYAGDSFDRALLTPLVGLPWMREAGALLVFTAVFDRNQRKYGERGYRYILHEAGHIGQNVYLVGEALGLKILALAGTNDEPIERLLDIDGVTESLVYAILAGK